VALSRAGGFGLSSALMGPLVRQAGSDGTTGGGLSTVLPASFDLPESAPLSTSMESSPALPAGRVTSAFGWRKDPIDGAVKLHKGMDVAMPIGSDVPTARDGTVAFSGEMPGYGLTVVVQHDVHTSTRYAHLSEVLVKPGDAVTAGQTIAHSGNSGRTTGPHLHFEVLEDGLAVNPEGSW
jgi:murein DD-endopeptidase MepM/ murein hydrolase activator NlpD